MHQISCDTIQNNRIKRNNGRRLAMFGEVLIFNENWIHLTKTD